MSGIPAGAASISASCRFRRELRLREEISVHCRGLATPSLLRLQPIGALRRCHAKARSIRQCPNIRFAIISFFGA